MEKAIKVAVILTAYDKMTREIRNAVERSSAEYAKLGKARDLFGKGMGQFAAGAGIAATLAPAVSAYAQLEDSTTRLKTAMMGVGGVVGPEFEQVNKLAIQLGNKLPGTTADFQNMFEVMLNNGIPAQTILDGVGESAAYLAVALKLPYEEAAKMSAKLKEATGVANKDMMAFLDTIAKTKNVGVEVGEMQYAFGRSAGALKLMGLQGLEASKGVSAVYAQLIRAGLSGETVGTGFASVLNALLDEKKMAKTKAAADELGVSLEFFKNGQFAGIENFVKQLDKLKGFSAEQRASVVNALTGGGQDAQMLQTLINNGVEGYAKIQAAMEKQANLNDKVNAQLGTLSSIWEATTGTITNALAAIGASIGPELKMVADAIGQLAGKIQEFADAHPKLFKAISLMIAGAGAMLMIVGVINMIRGAFIALQIVMAANPFILLAMAAIAAVALIYAYWDEITAFFSQLWEDIKAVFNAGVQWVKSNWDLLVMGLLAPWIPLGKLLIDAIKAIFPEMYNAGAEIVSGLFNGMKAKFDEGIQKVKDMASQISTSFKEVLGIRSPSRVFIQHGMNVTQGAVIGMNKGLGNISRAAGVAASVMAAPVMAAAAPVPVAGGGGGGFSITYSPQVTLGAGTTPAQAADFAALLKEHSRELMNIISDTMARDSRKRF